ncbi:MAG: protein kinase [Nannocystaceae bacterium]
MGEASTDFALPMDPSADGIANEAARVTLKRRMFDADTDAPTIGRYAVLRVIGEGGMGTVYAAYDEQLERKVAVKLVKGESNRTRRRRMIREAQAMARLSHPNVVPVFEVGEHQGRLFIAMEYVKGQTLRQWREEEERTIPEIVAKYVEAGRGLAAAHAEGMVHRDFKPHNAMVGTDGRVRVLDFGLAGKDGTKAPTGSFDSIGPEPQALDERITETGALMGTPAYMAPEQFLGGTTDHRTDQYSFCVALWEAVHGLRPFGGTHPVELFAQMTNGKPEPAADGRVPAWLRETLARGLEVEPNARWPAMGELLDELVRGCAPPPRRRWGGWLVSVAVVCMGLLGLASIKGDRPISPRADSIAHGLGDERQAILDASHLPEPLADPLSDDPMRTTIHRLDNGLTVYVSPMKDVDETAIALGVRAGTRHAAAGKEGAPSVLASVLNRGSRSLGVRDQARAREYRGRLAEAHQRLASSKVDGRREAVAAVDALRLEYRDAFAPGEVSRLYDELDVHSRFSRAAFDGTLMVGVSSRPEAHLALLAELTLDPDFREVLPSVAEWLEGANLVAREPTFVVREAIATVAFGEHPWAYNVAWPFERIQDTTRADLLELYEARYAPNNAALFLCGDIDPANAQDLVQRYFGDWTMAATAPVPEEPSLPEPLRRIEVTHPGQASVTLVFVVPEPPAEDELDMEILLTLLEERLEQQPGLTPHRVVGRGRWAWGIQVDALGENTLTQTEQRARAIIGDLRDIAFDPNDIGRVLEERRVSRQRRMEEPYVRCREMMSSYLEGDSWRETVARRDDRDVDVSSLGHIAAAVLAANPSVVVAEEGALEPTNYEVPEMTELPSKTQELGEAAQEILARGSSRVQPQFLLEGEDYTRTEIPGGELIASRNPRSELFMLEITTNWGARRQPLLCASMGLPTAIWRNYSNDGGLMDEIDGGWERAGTTVKVSCELDGVRMHIAGRDESFDGALAELDRWMRTHVISREEYRSWLEVRLAERRQGIGLDRFMLIREWVFRGARSGPLNRPSRRALSRADPSGLTSLRSKLWDQEHTVLYFGPRQAPDVERVLETVWPDDLPPVEPAGEPPPREPEIRLERSPGETLTTATFAFIDSSTAWSAKHQATSRVMSKLWRARQERLNEVLGAGDSGRIGCFYARPRAEPEPFEGGVCQLLSVPSTELARVTHEVIDVLFESPTASHFEMARNLVKSEMKRSRSSPREVPWIVAGWPQGAQNDPRQAELRALSRLTVDDVRAAMARTRGSTFVMGATGDPELVDLESLGHLAPVIVVAEGSFEVD